MGASDADLIEIIGGAMQRPAPEREAYILRACPDPAARSEAIRLLSALGRAGRFMDGPVATPGAPGALEEGPGSVIGRYLLLEQIGEGGFGVVFKAEQREPVQRTVALKVIKLGMDTRAVVARFEAERQALALMDHPCIAKVLDAGATDSGRPYFVMELVRGEPITRFCSARALSARQRLELLVQVCLAVQHAHTKGIIHRDLKPANILVSEVDGRPLPRIIDFGIAKATGALAVGREAFTEVRQFIGTPEYMSPEQADGPGVDVDTRTDIYSLGVLLYELLTGATPLDGAELRSAAWDQMLRMIREVEPARPSTRAAARSATDQTAPPALPGAAALRGDLDWIIMCCLEKDRARRYQTAEGLAADLGRHLGGEAVLAAPPSRLYQLRKFGGRHRAGVSAAGVAVASLVAGLSVSLWQAGVAARERDRAEARRKDTERVAEFQAAQLRDIDPQLMGAWLREDLLGAMQRAPAHAAESDDARSRLSDLLTAVNLTDVALRVLDRNVFARTIAAIDGQFQGQPAIRADLLLTVAQTMMEVGLLEGAEAPLRTAWAIRREQLGEEDPATIRAAAAVAELLVRLQWLPAAEEQLDRTLSVARRVLGEHDPVTISVLSNTGLLRYMQGKVIDAERLFREVLEKRRLGNPDDPRLFAALANVALVLTSRGKPAEAESAFRLALEGFRRVRGDDHRDTLKTLNNLANVLRVQDKFDQAEPLVREALAKKRARLGSDHAETLMSGFTLGQLLVARAGGADLIEADAIVGETLERRRRALGEFHDETLRSLDQLATLRMAQSRPAEAEAILRELAVAFQSQGAGASPVALAARLDLGRALTALARFAEAEQELLEVSRILSAGHGGHGAGRGLGGADPCAEHLVELYTAWDAAEPGKGYDARASEWRARLGPESRGTGSGAHGPAR